MPDATPLNPLGIRSIQEAKELSYGEMVKKIIEQIFTWDWIFSKWYEKIIVLGSIAYTMVSVWRLIF